MGILDLVLRVLRQGGFPAEVAYPGQSFPQIREPVAAVHISEVDRGQQRITVEVSIVAPASFGGTACEVEALRATEILRWNGASCLQKGCQYDGVAQVYLVPILAEFYGINGQEGFRQGRGFSVFVDNLRLPWVEKIEIREIQGAELLYASGESEPKATAVGQRQYEIRMEELCPSGSSEYEKSQAEFTLKLELGDKTEIYRGCRWTDIQREYSQAGLRSSCRGIARRKERSYGENAV